MDYHTKYDDANKGTIGVFNTFYYILEHAGVVSNLVACCGRDYNRYLDYVPKVCRGGPAKAFFIENARDHLKVISDGLKNSKKTSKRRVRLLFGDVTCYEGIQGAPTSARIEDLGLGVGIRDMLSIGQLRLRRQLVASGTGKARYRWKAQILDSALRGVPCWECYELYKSYLNVLGLEIRSINGEDIEEAPYLFADSRSGAEVVYSYKSKNGHRNKVFKHEVELKPNNRSAKLYMFTCKNGSLMLQTMLMYK